MTETAIDDAIGVPPSLAAVEAVVREAGRIALGYFRANPEQTKKADGSAVSVADLATDQYLKTTLLAVMPEAGWLSEETEDDASRLARRAVWIVDPIDGTAAFLDGFDAWAVCVALVIDGRPVLAAVYNPARDEMFSAHLGQGARLNGEPIWVSNRAELAGAKILSSKGLPRRKFWLEPWPDVEVRWVYSIAYRLMLVAAGRADAVVSLSPKSAWDLAAAELIVQEAGGRATDRFGHAFVYNTASTRLSSVIAAPPLLHTELIRRTAPIALDS